MVSSQMSLLWWFASFLGVFVGVLFGRLILLVGVIVGVFFGGCLLVFFSRSFSFLLPLWSKSLKVGVFMSYYFCC
jgi:hypothetical protein